MLFSKVIEGYLLDAQARKLSPNTIRDYRSSFKRLYVFTGDVELDTITVTQGRTFMASLTGLRGKTARNIYVGLSALWTWARQERIITEHIWREIRPPKADSRAVIPFTEADVRALIRASVKVIAEREGKQYTSKLHMAKRNKSIVLFLLDTGVRASELCDLKMSDIDLGNARVRVMGKGRRERLIDFSPITAKTLWRYTTERKAAANDWLFVTDEGGKLGRDDLARLVRRIGKRAGVADVFPHRFRHSFAVFSLMNGIDPYTLQTALGHSSMEMVRRYLHVAQIDSARLQRKASPIANLGLGG